MRPLRVVVPAKVTLSFKEMVVELLVRVKLPETSSIV